MPDPNIKLSAGNHVIVIRNRYETLTLVNDVLIGVWFLIGSILFLNENAQNVAIGFFIAGSAELLIRPTIRLARNLHVRRISSGGESENSSDPSAGG